LEFLQKLHCDFTHFPVFVETGTYNGDTIFTVEPLFSKLFTVEFSPLYYERTRSKYGGNKINFILGDSSDIFHDLLPTITDDVIFFLDGHWSSGDTGKSAKDCPLIEELTQINSRFSGNAVIIIDDFRLFGTKTAEDWSQITKSAVLSVIAERITNVYHLPSDYAPDDRLIIHIKKN